MMFTEHYGPDWPVWGSGYDASKMCVGRPWGSNPNRQKELFDPHLHLLSTGRAMEGWGVPWVGWECYG